MSEIIDFTQFGGVLRPTFIPGGEPVWDFGRLVDPAAAEKVKNNLRLMNGTDDVYTLYPGLEGFGEGKTVILHDIAKKVMGGIPSQYQSRGTCVSRGMKRACDLNQCISIYCGAPYKFSLVSHAYAYGSMREHINFLSWTQDGGTGSGGAWSVANDGSLRNEDTEDDDNKDDLAVKWGATGVPEAIKKKGRLHLVQRVVNLKTFNEVRDFICAGLGAVTVASGAGFKTTRDKDGICRRSGVWMHQMTFTSYRADMDCLLQDQSWGANNPSGPCVLGQPDYSFWTTRADAESQIKEGETFGFSWLHAWDGEGVTFRP